MTHHPSFLSSSNNDEMFVYDVYDPTIGENSDMYARCKFCNAIVFEEVFDTHHCEDVVQ